MYESPIKLIQEATRIEVENNIYKAVQRTNIDVNEEELVKALLYDRNQYEKGYNDALNEERKRITEELIPVLNNYDDMIMAGKIIAIINPIEN